MPGCHRTPVEAHHLRACDDPQGMSIKSGDDKTAPLCVHHHTGDDGVQNAPDERQWAKDHGVDLEQEAAHLWFLTQHKGRKL